MKHSLTLFLYIVLISVDAQAAPSQPTLKEGDMLRGNFSETRRMHGFKGPMTSTGHFVIIPEHGLVWDTDKPFVIKTIITPEGLQQKIDGEQVTNLDATKIPYLSHLYETLGGALTGNTQALNKDFMITRTQSGTLWTLNLKPRADTVLPFSAITVTGHHFVDTVHMVRSDGDIEDITFNEQTIVPITPDIPELEDFYTSGL